MTKQKLIFGTESYIYGDFYFIKLKQRNWVKQPYMAQITGTADKYDFKRSFRERGYIKGKNNENVAVFKLPMIGGIVELGWASRVDGQKECSTIFIQWSNEVGEWVEITKAEAIAGAKEMDNDYNNQGEEYEV